MPDREKVINELSELEGFLFSEYGKVSANEANIWYDRFLTVSDALALLKEQEAKIEQLNRFVNGFSRDAMPVVRCKDCINYGNNGCRLKRMAYQTASDWFCADGERR